VKPPVSSSNYGALDSARVVGQIQQIQFNIDQNPPELNGFIYDQTKNAILKLNAVLVVAYTKIKNSTNSSLNKIQANEDD